jgi:hypothetical protein
MVKCWPLFDLSIGVVHMVQGPSFGDEGKEIWDGALQSSWFETKPVDRGVWRSTNRINTIEIRCG